MLIKCVLCLCIFFQGQLEIFNVCYEACASWYLGFLPTQTISLFDTALRGTTVKYYFTGDRLVVRHLTYLVHWVSSPFSLV